MIIFKEYEIIESHPHASCSNMHKQPMAPMLTILIYNPLSTLIHPNMHKKNNQPHQSIQYVVMEQILDDMVDDDLKSQP